MKSVCPGVLEGLQRPARPCLPAEGEPRKTCLQGLNRSQAEGEGSERHGGNAGLGTAQ